MWSDNINGLVCMMKRSCSKQEKGDIPEKDPNIPHGIIMPGLLNHPRDQDRRREV